MADRVFPSSKPAAPPTAVNGNSTAPAPADKSHLYNPTAARQPYRPQPHNRRHHRGRSGRSICCCVCFWTVLVFLLLLLVAAIAGTALYVLYRPHKPAFAVPSLRIHRLNLTTSADTVSSHVSTLLNLTLTSKNPNSHLSFFYEPFTVSAFASNDVLLGNGSLPAYAQVKKNETSFRNVVIVGSQDLDTDTGNGLRSDLKKKNGAVTLKLQLDTKVRVKVGGVKTKKVGIRVTCDDIKGTVPKGKSPTVAVTTGSKCKVDLRVKILRWTF